jgi:Fe-S-cluster containining protein
MQSEIHYRCQRCTNCCRWPGFVKIDADETAPIAAHLGLSEDDFIQRFTQLRPQRDGLALVDRPPSADGSPDHACIFLEGRDCVIQAVKPRQCVGFPNAWNFPGWREVCEALPALSPKPAD